MSNAEWKIPAIKYSELHGVEKNVSRHQKTLDQNNPRELSFPSIFNWWKNRIESTYEKYRAYSDVKILTKCYLFSLIFPFLYFDLINWILWFCGYSISTPKMDPSFPISAVVVAPILETLIIFFPLLEISRVISLPRWFSYPAIFIFFESLHDQRSFFEHPIMWMTGYMFIVAYEAGRTRSLLHAILFCIVVHEAYNITCFIGPSLFSNLF